MGQVGCVVETFTIAVMPRIDRTRDGQSRGAFDVRSWTGTIGTGRVARDVVDAMIDPRIVKISPELFGVAFSLMKLVPAAYMLERAEAEGALQRGMEVLETTSGTFGLGLALVAKQMGYKVYLVSDAIVDSSMQTRLRDLGASVEIVEPRDGANPQQARLDRVRSLLDAHQSNYYWPNQYDSPWNAESYASVAGAVLAALGHVDVLVGPVGSGGSMCGTATALRRHLPGLQVVAVDTPGSVLFGQPEAPRLLRGLGNSVLPGNLRHDLFDHVHWVTAAEAFAATRELHRSSGLFMGPTSGAAFLVARWLSQRRPDQRVAMLMPDDGARYQTTVYDDEWLVGRGFALEDVPDGPVEVYAGTDAPFDCWSCMRWDRRRIDEAQ